MICAVGQSQRDASEPSCLFWSDWITHTPGKGQDRNRPPIRLADREYLSSAIIAIGASIRGILARSLSAVSLARQSSFCRRVGGGDNSCWKATRSIERRARLSGCLAVR